MAIRKVVSKNAISKLQVKKTVYYSDRDFNMYSPKLIKRWRRYNDIDIFILNNCDKWVLKESIQSDCKLNCDKCWLNIGNGRCKG